MHTRSGIEFRMQSNHNRTGRRGTIRKLEIKIKNEIERRLVARAKRRTQQRPKQRAYSRVCMCASPFARIQKLESFYSRPLTLNTGYGFSICSFFHIEIILSLSSHQQISAAVRICVLENYTRSPLTPIQLHFNLRDSFCSNLSHPPRLPFYSNNFSVNA